MLPSTNESRASAPQKTTKLDKDNSVEAPDDIVDSIIDFYGLSNGLDRRIFPLFRSLDRGEEHDLLRFSPGLRPCLIWDL
jgi:hypothetical protein